MFEPSVVEKGCRAERFLLAEQADSCVRRLQSIGLEIINVEKGPMGARVNIRPSALCAEKFETVISGVYERSAGVGRRYSYTILLGCEVRWVEGVVQ